MKKISEIPYLLASDEFRCFSTASIDVGQQLAALNNQTYQELKEKLITELNIGPEIEEQQSKLNREAVYDFGSFLKRIIIPLKTIREQAKKMVNTKELENKKTRIVIETLSKYETTNLIKYADDNNSKLVVENSSNNEPLKNRGAGMTQKLANTFKDFFHWIKGELSDVEAARDAIAGKDHVVQTKIKLENKKKSEQNELDELNKGKKTFKNIFKSASGKQSRITVLTASIQRAEEDIEIIDEIIKLIEAHIATNVIPQFKEKQTKNYYIFLNFLAKRELNNSAAINSFWSDFIKHPNLSQEE